jgi:hypothetical protein
VHINLFIVHSLAYLLILGNLFIVEGCASFKYNKDKNITYFTSEPSNPSEPSTFLMSVYCNAPSATQLQFTTIYRTQKYYSDSSLLDASTISTAQVRAL